MRARRIPSKALACAAAALLGSAALATTAIAEESSMPVNAKSATPPDFKTYDQNGDGFVSLEEFQAQKKEPRAFQEADQNKDGRLDANELIIARAIHDRMQAGDYARDAWITTKVKAMIMKDSVMNGFDVGVETHDGVVQLSGWVDDVDKVNRAVTTASRVEGVKRVRNDLEIKKQ